MTKKRMIKLLMSEGISRNEAAHLAKVSGPDVPHSLLALRIMLASSTREVLNAISKLEATTVSFKYPSDEDQQL